MKRRLITSALPYVNNVPHLGNLIQVLSADVFARFCRLRGYETLYICGTDEYGTATETKALEEGISPRELCDRYHKLHKEIYEWFAISFDKFGRTSTPIQTEVVQDIFKKLDAQGFILERTIEQLHCGSCNRFLADRYVRGTCPHCGYSDARGDQCEQCGKLLEPTELQDPRCSTCGATPVLRGTRHLYIDLPQIKDRLEAWIARASVEGFWANNAIQMTNAWIRDGLKERAITRDLKWGIPVPKPGYEDKVFYVWFDAPIGYISITGTYAEEQGLDWRAFIERWWKNPEEVELFQFIGKDNIPFHTVIFPSSLLGTGEKWTLLHHMSSTEYLNYEGGKFSKSKGIGVFGTDAMESGIPADVWRFYIFYNRPEKSDTLFTWKDFQERVNSELIGNLGNLVNRTLSFVHQYYDGRIPKGSRNEAFWNVVRQYEQRITEKLEQAELRDALREIFELSSFANKAFQDGEPWKKRSEDPPSAAGLIRDLSYVVRDLAILIHPYLPRAAERIAVFLGTTIGKGGLSWSHLGNCEGLDTIQRPEVLFSRLEDPLVQALRERYNGTQKEREERSDTGHASEKNIISKKADETFSVRAREFASLVDLRVAKILTVERHPKADKLYIETLDMGGGEQRVIVSGLVPYYRAEELEGKHIIVVYNLKPALLRGVESRGMLLAASRKDEGGNNLVEVLEAPWAEPGTRVVLQGYSAVATPAEIDIDTFFAVPIRVVGGQVQVEGFPLMAAGRIITTARVLDGEVG